MHSVKNQILAIIAIVSFSCYAQNVEVMLTNKTGFNIDSLQLSRNYIGLLKNDATVIVRFDAIYMQSGGLVEFPNGVIIGKTRQKADWECATGMEKVTSGKYSFDIVMREDEAGYLLFYSRHRKR